MRLRALRRDRAFRSGPAMFLFERAFTDIMERLSTVRRTFRSALLIGTPGADWPRRLAEIAKDVTAIDPGPLFASAVGGNQGVEDELDLEPSSFDLCVAVGTLDSANRLPEALLRLRLLLKADSLLIGVMAGGDTLPRLREAMRAADLAVGTASPHVHPRIEPAALAQLLGSVGLEMPVVDVDRVRVAYRDFRRLVADLRGMGATNILNARSPRPLTRDAFAAAQRSFESAGEGTTEELFELLHFAAWSPADTGPAPDD